MTGINSDTESQKWIIAPETSFLRLAEDMAQSAAVNSVEFLERKAEVKTALDTAFKDAEEVFAQYLPSAINRAVSTEQFRSSLPSEPMALGELIGHTGFLASRAKKAKRKTAIHAAYDSRRAMVELKRFHIRIYDRTLGQIGTARRNASIGIPRLTNDTRYKLEYLYGLERAQLTEAVSENLNYIAEIKAFHEAVRAALVWHIRSLGKHRLH